MSVGGALVERIGIERLEVALIGVAQGLGRCRQACQGDETRTDRRKQTLTYRHLILFPVMMSRLAPAGRYYRCMLPEFAARASAISLIVDRFARRCRNG